MGAQDHQPQPIPVAGTQVTSAGTDESTARGDVRSEADESTARAGPLQRIKRGLGGFVAGFRGATWEREADKEIVDDLKKFLELRSLSDVGKQQLIPRIASLLRTRRRFLRSEKAVEAIANRVTWILGICAVVVPAVVIGLTMPRHGGAVGTYFLELALLAAVATWPAGVLETLTGRRRAGLIWAALVLWTCVAVAVWIVVAPGSGQGPSREDGTILVAVVFAATALTIVLVARVYLVAWNSSALTNAWAEQWLEAAVLRNLLQVVVVLEASLPEPRSNGTTTPEPRSGGTATPLRPLELSGLARGLLAQAAEAVHDYLPRLIDHGGRAYGADAQSITSEVAAALLDLRSAVNLPGGRVREEDLARLTATIKAWSIGSLADMPRTVPPAADSLESSNRRPGLLPVVGKLLLGALPLILLIVVTLLPLKMSAAVTAALAPFAVTWLLVSIASVFSPADVKMDLKTLFNR